MAAFEEETTTDPRYADARNFYKVEKWSRDGMRVDLVLYAGSSLDSGARSVRRHSQTSTTHSVDYPTTDARAAGVATDIRKILSIAPMRRQVVAICCRRYFDDDTETLSTRQQPHRHEVPINPDSGSQLPISRTAILLGQR